MITIAFASGRGLETRFRLYTNDSFNGDGFCQDQSRQALCHARASGAAFQSEVDCYLRSRLMEPFVLFKIAPPVLLAGLILYRRNFLLGAPSIIMSPQMNIVRIDVMAAEPTA